MQIVAVFFALFLVFTSAFAQFSLPPDVLSVDATQARITIKSDQLTLDGPGSFQYLPPMGSSTSYLFHVYANLSAFEYFSSGDVWTEFAPNADTGNWELSGAANLADADTCYDTTVGSSKGTYNGTVVCSEWKLTSASAQWASKCSARLALGSIDFQLSAVTDIGKLLQYTIISTSDQKTTLINILVDDESGQLPSGSDLQPPGECSPARSTKRSLIASLLGF